MLNHPTFEKLKQMRFTGMIKALEEQAQNPEIDALSFEERLGLLVDRELDERETRRLKRRLKDAKLRQEASIEDVDFRAPRGLDKALIATLAGCAWITRQLNVIITGPTGVGKTYLATALAHKACLQGYNVLYQKLSRLLEELRIARAGGTYGKRLVQLSKLHVLVLDDWGLAKLTTESQRDLLEVLDDRHGKQSTIVTSQIPVDQWHEAMPDPTIADAILDRLVHNTYRVELRGESMRKRRASRPDKDDETGGVVP
jgi:DNA replication protein DnaC